MRGGELRVNKIRAGVVIDHISAGQALNVLKVLGINKDTLVTVLMNVPSVSMVKKDIINVPDNLRKRVIFELKKIQLEIGKLERRLEKK